MTDLYSEWRDFYAEKVRSWMSLEELRAECGKLQTVDNPSPEVLLIHAMHALEELQAEVERLRADRDSWEQQASDRVADWHAEHLRAERLAEALRLIESAKDRGFGIDYARGVAQSALRDHDQEGHNG